jgi:subtilisin family serine protease
MSINAAVAGIRATLIFRRPVKLVDGARSDYAARRQHSSHWSISMKPRFASVAIALPILAIAAGASPQDKIRVEKLDDLPRHVYRIDGKVVDFLNDTAAIRKLGAEVRSDIEDDLAKLDIQDRATLKSFYANLGVIALLDGRWNDYLETLTRTRELEDKESQRLMAGVFERAYIAAQPAEPDRRAAVFSARFAELLGALPYEVVEADVKAMKGLSEILSHELMLGASGARLQPIVDESGGEISKDIATTLLTTAYALHFPIPLKESSVPVLAAYLEAHDVVRPDIWTARDISLAASDGVQPVVLAVWDSGVDMAIFAKSSQAWTNSAETDGNGVDDDRNGFVDDVHGIAWSLHSDKEIPLLYDIGDVTTDRPVLQRRLKGFMDVQASIDSPEATDIKRALSELPQSETKDFLENLNKYGNYCHGTHVAGIAARGNPYARLLAVRMTFDHRLIPETPTVELSKKSAQAARETVAYFQGNGVRVVNMSWGGDLRSIEQALEANNAGGTAEERQALARRIFQIERDGLYEAIRSAPEILFVAAAGNADSDNVFEEFFPSSFDLPNLLTAAAVDQAGDETSFTSFGKADIYANGFEVPSFVPGGDELKLSGTSMAAPYVMNLAGKILARRPDLSIAQVRDLILRGGEDRAAGQRTVRLLNPKRSMELLAQQQ